MLWFSLSSLDSSVFRLQIFFACAFWICLPLLDIFGWFDPDLPNNQWVFLYQTKHCTETDLPMASAFESKILLSWCFWHKLWRICWYKKNRTCSSLNLSIPNTLFESVTTLVILLLMILAFNVSAPSVPSYQTCPKQACIIRFLFTDIHVLEQKNNNKQLLHEWHLYAISIQHIVLPQASWNRWNRQMLSNAVCSHPVRSCYIVSTR